MNKVLIFQERLLSDTFMTELEDCSIKRELQSSILEAYEYRLRLKHSQNKWSELHNISIATVKRIENGSCYDIRLINKYCE